MKRFDALLSSLPSGCIFDGEIVVLDEFDRLRFNALSSAGARRQYVAFDVLYANAQDARAMPLSSRKSVLKQLLRGRHDLIVMEGIAGKGTRLFNAVCELDLEGIVANRMSDPYTPETKWFKIPEHPNGPRRPHPQAHRLRGHHQLAQSRQKHQAQLKEQQPRRRKDCQFA